MDKDNELELIETIQKKDNKIKELEEQIEINKSWVKFDIKNTTDILRQSENLAILMLKDITETKFSAIGFEQEIKHYNIKINNLIKVLETMKTGILEEE